MIKNRISNKEIKKNISLSVGVKALSIIGSIILGLIVPKFIPQLQYAYWRTYLLYVGYVGILHLGLLDGIVLRYSKYDYEELNSNKMQSQFQFLLLLTSLFSLFIIIMANIYFQGINKIIIYLISISVIVKNINAYTSFLFQTTNRIKYYALLAVLHRIIYIVIILALLVGKSDYFVGFCLADIMADLVSVLIICRKNKGLYFGKAIPFFDMLAESWNNISSGILLMIANWSAMLLLSSATMVIQWHWDAITFAKIAFGFSLANIFLIFIPSISVVLFPTIKRLSDDRLPDLYIKVRQSLSILMFLLMLGYFPGGYIIKLWLPKYTDSIAYVGILLPLVVFSSKFTLLTNNYLKAYREEKKMFILNIYSLIVAFLVYLLCTYVFNNLTAMLVSIVLMIMLRSVISEMIVSKLINKNFKFDFICEAIMSVGFMISARYFSLFTGFFVYVVFTTIYMLVYKKEFLQVFKSIKNIAFRHS